MHRSARAAAVVATAIGMTIGVAAPATAHVVKQIGPYSVAIGWVREPTYVSEENAVQVVIKDSAGNPVSDLSADDLKVVVSAGNQQSDPMSLAPTFDEDTGLGIPGDYEATIIPTAPGDYTFRVTGTIHDQSVDETVTSSDSTFDAVVESTAIQFPLKLPALSGVITRLDRIDARIAADRTSTEEAAAAATRALVVGIVIGGLGVLIGGAALFMSLRRRPQSSA
jgi:hypothetical protein